MSEDAVPRPGPGGPVRAVLVVTMWVLVATFAGLVALTGAGASVDAVALDATVGLAAVWSAAVVCWVAVGRARRRQRDVLLATGGVTAFAVGVGAYGVEVALTGSVAIPSVGDLGYLLFYPFMLAAMVLAVRPVGRRSGPVLPLDVAVIALAVGAVLAALIGPVPAPALVGDGRLAWAVAVGYPLLDLLLIGVLVGIGLLHGWRSVRGWRWLVGGLTVFAVTDLSFALWFDEATGLVEAPQQAGWALGLVLVAMWVDGAPLVERRAAGSPGPQRPDARPAVIARAAAAVATVTSVAILVAATRTSLSALSIGLAAATLLTLGARTQVAFRQIVRAADLHRLASTDDLTGLPNRRALNTEARRRLTGAGREQGLLLMDLDRFKEVNDSLGHQLGDRLLVEVGARLRARLREADLLARLGGDEFAILLDGATRAEALAVAAAVRAALVEPFVLDGITVHSSTSIGIALYPEHGEDLSTLLRKADIALYQAKGTRDRHLVYDGETGTDEADKGLRLRRVAELRTAVAEHQFRLHFQPKVDLRSGEVTGVEALVRWEHPERGLLQPASFLALVEQSGVRRAMTQEVLALAVDQAAVWQRAGLSLPIAVNLSPRCLVDDELPDQILSLLLSRGVEPAALRLEITEEVLMVDRERARGVLTRLRTGGVQIAVDDFGAGYSSLAYLRDLPIDELKLDRAFILPMSTDPRAAALVASTIELAHTLDLRIVAEGVEDPETCLELARLGCDQAQGFHISRPLPAVELERWLGSGALHAGSTPFPGSEAASAGFVADLAADPRSRSLCAPPVPDATA